MEHCPHIVPTMGFPSHRRDPEMGGGLSVKKLGAREGQRRG